MQRGVEIFGATVALPPPLMDCATLTQRFRIVTAWVSQADSVENV
jgi:hypothetical protein